MTFKIYKTIAGKVRVKYNCPHCNEALESELAEAGSKDTCPGCQKPFIVPGEAKRKEFEAQLRKQLEAKKEAERQRLAEAEQQRIAEAAALAQREAEREAERMAAQQQPQQPQWSEGLSIDAYAPPSTSVRTRQINGTPSNTSYPALEFYIWLLRIAGWICIASFGIYLIFGLLFALIAPGEQGLPMAIGAYVFGIVVVALTTLVPSLALFVSAQLLQLALDARRDLAKLVAQRATDS